MLQDTQSDREIAALMDAQNSFFNNLDDTLIDMIFVCIIIVKIGAVLLLATDFMGHGINCAYTPVFFLLHKNTVIKIKVPIHVCCFPVMESWLLTHRLQISS